MNYIPYARQLIDSSDIKAVSGVLKSDYITQGPRVAEFEKRVADYCGAKYAVALNSGTSALHAACFAIGIKSGDEVITSPITFVATANSILYCGGIPKFADILEDTITIDPSLVVKNITKKTKAIMPVDFAGHPAELEDIRKIALRHNIAVIEDAAHALGAEYKGKRIGCCKYSDMAILSFHAVKHITTGEGGMVLTNRKDLCDKLTMFRSHGITRNSSGFRVRSSESSRKWYYEMQLLGYNYRITDIQCALGLSQMERLDDFVKRRRKVAQFYKEEFSDIKEISCLNEREYAESSWHIFPVRIKKNRNKIFDRLMSQGIRTNVHYIPVYYHPYYKGLGYKKGLCLKAERYYRETLTLPLYAAMSNYQVRRVCDCVRNSLYE